MEQDRGTSTPPKVKGKSLGQRWAGLQPSKTVLVWACIITAIVTMIIGFNWGGWVTGGAAQSMSDKSSKDAVVSRLAPMCVAQFLQDPAKAEKLTEMKALSSYARGDYITKQGWATMSGEEKPDRNVATECAKLLMLITEVVAPPTTEVAPVTETAPTAEMTPTAATTPAAEMTPTPKQP